MAVFHIPTEIRQALRRLAAAPVVSAGAMLTLALGIGSAVVMVDVLDRILLRAPTHVADPDRVARVYIGTSGAPFTDRTGHATLDALGTLHAELDASAVYYGEQLSWGSGAEARRLEAVAQSPGYFAVLGLQPHLGSLEAAAAGREDAAVISHALWRQAFGGAPDVLGRPLRLGPETYTIVAVAPRGFAGIGHKAVDVWLPLAPRARQAYGNDWKQSAFFLQAIARLRPGASRERASERATAAYRAVSTRDWEQEAFLVLGDVRAARAPGVSIGTRVEVLIAGMSILVLLVACGNVASLLLVRGLHRGREFAVKTALGASRARLLREVLVEAALLAAGAGLAALLVVVTGGTLLRRLFLSPVAALAPPLDGRVVLIGALFCIAATFLLGLAPALRLTTRRALAPGRAVVLRPSRLLDLFSGLQVALSLPAIVAAALFVLSLRNAQGQDFGMRTDRVAIVTTNLGDVGRPRENHDAHRRIQARVAALPQVEAVALVQNLPMRSSSFFTIEVPGKDLSQGTVSSDTLPAYNAVDPSFFAVMGMRLVHGRFFTDAENRKGARSVAVVTESMARTIWPGERAVGKCFYMGGQTDDKPCTEVVGVVADARTFPSIRPTKQWASAYYEPIGQGGNSTDRALVVRTATSPDGLVRTLRHESQRAVAGLPFVDVHAFDDVFVSMLRPWRLGSTVFVAFGVLSAIVAAVGLAVVGAYGVTRRTREIGIRSALGAEPVELVQLVLGRSLAIVAGGLSIGLGLAWAGGRFLSAQLFDVAAGDPRVLAVAALGLLAVGVAAGWLPARRAARIDPVAALRVE